MDKVELEYPTCIHNVWGEFDAALVELDAAAEIARQTGDRTELGNQAGALSNVRRYMELKSAPINFVIRSEELGGTVAITITDSGVGMMPEIQQRIFEPFFTTRDVGEGKGLGLSIAWGIVEKHGGGIEVRSGPGEGSVLAITLPVIMEQQ
jgi:nitrogen fixation/metabolism regulation signal transduction histidine kinase